MKPVVPLQPSLPDAAYFESRHPDLTPAHRWVLVDWLMELTTDSLPLSQETLCLSISLVDRFLSQTTGAPRSKLQLIGSVCLMLAAKCTEAEAICPLLSDMEYFCDYAYSVEQLRKTEAMVIRQLGFEFRVTVVELLEPLIAKASCDEQELARLLLDLSLLSLVSLQRPPATLAAAICHLAVPSAASTNDPDVLDTMQDLRLVYKHTLGSLKPNPDGASSAPPSPISPPQRSTPSPAPSSAASTPRSAISLTSTGACGSGSAESSSVCVTWPSPGSACVATPVSRKRERSDEDPDGCVVSKRRRSSHHLQLDSCDPAVCGAMTVFRKYRARLGCDVAAWPSLGEHPR
jgi:hypothetical protein